VSILLGNGDGTFRPDVEFPIGSGPLAIIAQDFNSDAKLDLATANYDSHNVSVLLGNGNGTFGPAQHLVAGNSTRSLTAADFDGDGKLDIAAANYRAHNVSVFLGNGNGTFRTAPPIPVGLNPASIAAGQFGGDAKPDLVVSRRQNCAELDQHHRNCSRIASLMRVFLITERSMLLSRSADVARAACR
jgi:hypothetical protein